MGRSLGALCGTRWKAKSHRPGATVGRSDAASEIPTRASRAGRNAQGEGWKTIASGARKHPSARGWQGEFKNQSAKSGGENLFICGTPPFGGFGGLRDR